MPQILHVYNVFGSGTERAWLDYPLTLEESGWQPAFACEAMATEAPSHIDPRPVVLRRIEVKPTHDVAAQMQAIAEGPLDPAMEYAIDTHRPAVVHGHFGPRMLHLAPLLQRGLPCVVSLYGYDASRLLRDVTWLARYRWFAQRGGVFAVLSRHMRDRLIAAGVPESQTRIIHLGVDPEQWQFKPRAAPQPAKFVFLGRLTAKKAPMDAVRAVQILNRDHGVEAYLDIVGDGPLRDEVREGVEQAGLSSRVRLHGAIPREYVGSLLRNATAMVLPSVIAADGDCEGTPVALMEAQAMGVNCITTRHAGNPEVLPPNSPMLAEENNPQDLAEVMRRVVAMSADEYYKHQRLGRAWIESQFSLRQTCAAYARLYEQLMARTHRDATRGVAA